MVTTTGSQLLPQKAIRELREHLLPITTILTPNVPEAKLILSDAGKSFDDPKNVEDLISIAKSVQSLGPKYVLVKGGHLPFKKDGSIATNNEDKALVIDILYGEGIVTRLETVYQKSKNTHGTGCSLACEFENPAQQGSILICNSCHCFEPRQSCGDDSSSKTGLQVC